MGKFRTSSGRTPTKGVFQNITNEQRQAIQAGISQIPGTTTFPHVFEPMPAFRGPEGRISATFMFSKDFHIINRLNVEALMEFDPSLHLEEALLIEKESYLARRTIQTLSKAEQEQILEVFYTVVAKAPKATLHTLVIQQFVKVLFRVCGLEEGMFAKRLIKRFAVHRTKRLAKLATKHVGKVSVAAPAHVINTLKPSIEFDTSNFDRALVEYMKFTKKSLVEVVNTKAFNISVKAIKYTKKANPADIRAQLNATSYANPNLSVAEAIALKRMGGFANIKKIRQKAKKLIAARTRAVAFLRSGWIPAIKILGASLPWVNKTGPDIKRGKDKGGAIAANPFDGLTNTEAVIWNSIQADGDSKAHEYMVQGLEQAFNEEAASMEAYVKRKMEQAAARVNNGN